MKNNLPSILLAGIAILTTSFATLYISIFLFPGMMEEYYNAVFRSASFETDWLFYVHPFVLAAALKWLWDRSKESLSGNTVVRALKIGAVYTLVATVPVLWLTFSAVNISLIMVVTWIVYGFLQAFVGGLIFAARHP
ncbi:MAG: hypothetical protein JNM57_04710 [Cyclobacteriaceae bacterium]|nr:hypothetical protein [Cyclobacteriaceae bacterium]